MACQKYVLINVSDKIGLVEFTRGLTKLNFCLVGSDDTCAYLQQNNSIVERIADFIKCPEILGREKTLHPAILEGILSHNTPNDQKNLNERNHRKIDMVVCNLYPFSSIIQATNTLDEEAIKNIDIGGVTLLRAAAKNHSRVIIVSDPEDYELVLEELSRSNTAEISLKTRQWLATKAFSHTARYDSIVSDYFRKAFENNVCQINLKYGLNPYQTPAQIYNPNGPLPLKVLNGSPGYINFCDALNGWQLVKELKKALNVPAATSFKHVNPAGAAVYLPSDRQEDFYLASGAKMPLSPLAIAYIKARSADPVASYGDFISLSDVCDVSTAQIISREVSDGIIAPGYDEESLKILSKKKNGRYCILQIDRTYEPTSLELRTVFGLQLEQKRNDVVIEDSLFTNIVTENKRFTEVARRDMLVATIVVKYTHSNGICLVKNGQVIGTGAGQQSRILSTRLACDKADNWWLRQHQNIRKLKFHPGVTRNDRANAIDYYVTLNPALANESELKTWSALFEETPTPFTTEERKAWINKLDDVCLSSDTFITFRDNIDRANQSGVKYAFCKSGSVNDSSVIAASNEHGMVLIHTDLRFFHH